MCNETKAVVSCPQCGSSRNTYYSPGSDDLEVTCLDCERVFDKDENIAGGEMKDVSCPICGSYEVNPTGPADEENLVEYRCADCGAYFVDEASAMQEEA